MKGKRDEPEGRAPSRPVRAPLPYEPPRISSETIFETAALVACGKTVGQGACSLSERDS